MNLRTSVDGATSAQEADRARRQEALDRIHRELMACRRCPGVVGPVVSGAPVLSRVFLIGQAPGPHEGVVGRPFGWTAGKTLFRWIEQATGVDEARFRARVYMAAVARCFPGKSPKGGGDRKPDASEIERCGAFLREELEVMRPSLLLPVGTLAIEQVLGRKAPLVDVVGKVLPVTFLGIQTEAVCLPHPSGLSTWHRKEPGIGLLRQALERLSAHEAWRETFASAREAP